MSIKRRGNFGLKKSLNLFKLQRVRLPILIGNEAKNHFTQGFRQDGGQTDKGKWRKRKRDPKGGRRGILIGRKGGKLWKSIKVQRASWSHVSIASIGIRYAARHNEGLDGMPQREFLGQSKAMENKVARIIRLEMLKIFKG